MQIITSRQNSTIKEIRKLLRRQGRKKTGMSLVEGIAPVLSALENRAHLHWIVLAPDLLTSDFAREAVAAAESRGERILRVSPDVFASLSQRESPVGLAAVVRAEFSALDDLRVDDATVLTALYEVGDPGNLGTIIRTVDALRGGGLVLLGDSTDPFDPQAIRASMGTVFRLPIVRLAGGEPLLSFARRRGIRVVTTSARAECELAEAGLETPCVVLFGSEREGLPSDLLRAGDVSVRIPMDGGASSVNLAVACGIVLYEIRRRDS